MSFVTTGGTVWGEIFVNHLKEGKTLFHNPQNCLQSGLDKNTFCHLNKKEKTF